MGEIKDPRPIIGTCMKCGTEASYLYEYRTGWFICKAAVCWEEETERDSGKVERDEQFLKDYRRVVGGIQSD